MKSILYDIELKQFYLIYLRLKKMILVHFDGDKDLDFYLGELERIWANMQKLLKEIYE